MSSRFIVSTLLAVIALATQPALAQDASTSSARGLDATPASTTEWQAPAEPDARAIYSEIDADFRAKRYDVAAEKAVWFWEHGAEHEPSFSAVRVSFFLSDWFELAEEFPPARETIRAARAKAVRQVFSGAGVVEAFRDAVNLNEYFGDEDKSLELFEQACEAYPALAYSFFVYTERLLLKRERIEQWGRHARPLFIFANSRVLIPGKPCEHDRHSFGSLCRVHSDRKLAAERNARSLAALVKLGRHDEANRLFEGLSELGLVSEHLRLFNTAMTGEQPPSSSYPHPEPWTQLSSGDQRAR